MSGPLDIFGPDPLDAFGPASEDEAEEERLRRERLRVWRERLEASRDAPQFEKPGYSGAFADKIGNTVRSGAYDMFDLGVNKVLSPLAISGARARSRSLGAPQFLEEDIERARELDRESRQRLADASVDLPTPIAAAGFWAAEAAGMALDPLEALPGGLIARGATKAGRAARSALARGGRGVAEEALPGLARSVDIEGLTRSIDPPEVPSHAGQAGESPEAISRVSRGEKYYRVKPSGEVHPILNTVDAVDVKLNPGEAKVRVSADGRLDIEDAGRGTKPQVDAMERLREGERPAVPRETEEGEEYFLDLDAEEPSILPLGRKGKLSPPDDPFQYDASRLDVPETALDDIKSTQRSDEVMERRRTGMKVPDDPSELRAKVGMTEEDFLQSPPGTVFNSEQTQLLDSYASRYARRTEALRPKITAGKATEAEREAFAAARTRWIDLLGVSMANASEQGRALQIHQRLVTALDSPESLRTYLAKKLQLSKKGEKLTEAELDLLSKIDVNNPKELGELISRIQKPKWWEYPRELFYSSILSGVGTHGRNTVGNALHAASQVPVRVGASLVDAPLARLTGRQRERYMKEVLPSMHGMMEGFTDGLRRFREAWKRGAPAESKFDIPYGAKGDLNDLPSGVPRSAFERAPNRFVRERIAPVVNIPFRLLVAADELFKGVNRGAELRALATRSGIRKGLQGDELTDHVSRFLKDPPKEALDSAIDFERKMTFTNPLGDTAKHLENLKNSSPFLGYLIPFVRTPVNLFKRGVEFTPLNLPRAVNMARKGAPEAADELAKVALGSSVMGMMAMKAAAGDVAGPPPPGQAERDAFHEQGKEPFSVRFGDRWYSFSQIEPLAMPLAFVASANEGYLRGDPDATNFEKMQSAMALLLANQLDRSYLSGLSDLVELQTRGEEAFVGFAGRQAAAVGTPFSGFGRSAASAIDPRVTEKRTFGDYFAENIPGLRDQLPSRLTRFGEEIRKTRWQAAGPSGTPLTPSKITDDEVELALEELGLTVGFPGKSIEGVELSPDEYRAYLQRVGPQTKEILRRVLADDSFRQMPTRLQQKTIDQFVSSTRDVARAEMMMGLVPDIPPLMVKKELAAAAENFDMARSRADGISAEYNDATRNRGRVGLDDMQEASARAEERWSQAYSSLQASARDATRRGLTEKQVFNLLRRQGLSARLARSLVRGEEMSYADYQRGRD